jgi:hypothetical protein
MSVSRHRLVVNVTMRRSVLPVVTMQVTMGPMVNACH